MRTHITDGLDVLSGGLASMRRLAATAMTDSATALLDADLPSPNE
ncbi:hypothetical protein [Rhodococcus qingshengii]|nr:hypothetical protein [Rhodococcus qingshengii]